MLLELICLCRSKKSCCLTFTTQDGIKLIPFYDALEFIFTAALLRHTYITEVLWIQIYIILWANLALLIVRLVIGMLLVFHKHINKRAYKKYNEASRKYSLILLLIAVLANAGLSVYLSLYPDTYNDLNYGMCSVCFNLTNCELTYNYSYPILDR